MEGTGIPTARQRKPAAHESYDGVRIERAEALKRSRTGYIGQLTRNYKEIKNMMKSENFNDVDTVLRIKQKILNLFDNFERCCKQHLECLKEQEDIEEANVIYERELQVKEDIEVEIATWINSRTNPFIDPVDQPLIEPEDSISNSGSSECSRTSTATKLKLKAQADQAVAELKMKQLKEDQELEEKIEELSMQLQQMEARKLSKLERQRTLLQAQHELERRKTELKFYEEAEGAELDKTYEIVCPNMGSIDLTQNSYQAATEAEVLSPNPFATIRTPLSTNPFKVQGISTPVNPFSPTQNWNNIFYPEVLQKPQSTPTANAWLQMNTPKVCIAESKNCQPREQAVALIEKHKSTGVDEVVLSELMKQQERITCAMTNALMLPKPELLTFDGNPLHYWRFVRNYDQNIEAKTEDNGERLNYLLQYCTGKAKEVIKNCVVLDSNEGYATARKLLHERFGEPYAIATAYIELVTQGPPIRASDREGLRVFADKLKDCELTLRAIGYIDDLNNAENLKKIAERFPVDLKAKWLDKARVIRSKGGRPGIEHMSEYLSERAKAANDPVFGQIMDAKDPQRDRARQRPKPFQNTSRPTRGTTLATHQDQSGVVRSTNESQPSSHEKDLSNYKNSFQNVKCALCDQQHTLVDCNDFKKMAQPERMKLVRQKGLCDNCLKRGHRARNCYQRKNCEMNSCEGKHHSLLHPLKSSGVESYQNVSGSPPGSSQCHAVKVVETGTTVEVEDRGCICLPILPVRVRVKEGQNSIITYALLDQGSDISLCEKRLLNQLGIKSVERTFSLTTIGSANVQQKGFTANLEVTGLDSDDIVSLSTVWTVEKLNISTESVPKLKDVHTWPHLCEIQIPDIDIDNVTILIGNDTPEAFWALEQRRGKRKEPYATKTLLGWTIAGPMADYAERHSLNTYYLSSRDDDDLKSQVERFWVTDFGDSLLSTKEGMSTEDKRALATMQETTVMSEGHYQMALPWKNKNHCALNNRPMAEFRLATLKRRFLNDPGLYEKYKDVIHDHLSKGYARCVLNENIDHQKRVWYLPHHPVITPKKVRVVFDCAAKWKGVSLNDQLLQGPDQTNNLVGVLTRFREDRIALAADIEGMFLQVKVDPNDCDMLRFLWWPDGDLNQQPEDHQMLVHIFGASSSPSCANFALRKTADDNRSDFDDDIVNIVHRNFYVDDMLKSVNSVDDAKRVASDLSALLRRGGFRLTKWMSNSKEVLNSIPKTERATPVKNLDFDRLPKEGTLGVEWDVEEDSIGFKTQVKDKPLTRRGLLSITSSIYDPLGIAAPFVLLAKLILQDLCRQQLTWDEPIPEPSLVRWKSWLDDLPRLTSVSIPRCLKPPHLPDIVTYELHHFADASQSAYGSVSYLRMVATNTEVHCSFLNGKSRLAPVKPITIPRLELSAGVVAVKTDKMLLTELDLPLSESTFWTDSTTVLQFINNVSKRFNVFVANRIAIIHEGSSPHQWRYVNTKCNPADDASRGLTARKMTSEEGRRWLCGPEFLWKSKESWPAPIVKLPDIPCDNPEVKREKQIFATHQKRSEQGLQGIYEHYSNWYRLKIAIAWLIRFKTYIMEKFRKAKNNDKVDHVAQGRITVKELQGAEVDIIKDIQRQAFSREVKILSRQPKSLEVQDSSTRSNLPKNSCIFKLTPVLKDGVLLVGGRLQNAPISEVSKHPPILPKNHDVCKLIIEYYHLMHGHAGREHMLAMVRQRYWIVGARSLTRRILNTCFDCRRRKAPPISQQMADLPVDRLTPDEPPFTYVGTDFFGPFLVKRGRSVEKRYGCLFTCLTSRAVHLEVAHSLDVDSFINALQRFINRRGRPKELRSDNGTNYKGGERELRESLQEWNDQKIESFLKQRDIVWKFNPPGASSMGGIWERIIRSVRSILRALLKEQTTTDEVLLTLMTQVEAILNSRPLTTCSDDPNDDNPLTPNHILLLRSNASMPLGVFTPSDNYGRRRWRQCQYLANLFWRRWLKEYLPTLQLRQKWIRPQKNLAVGDVVLVVDETVKRGQWPLARVLDVFKAKDGYVRSARIKTPTSELLRPIHKLCMLEGAT